MCLDPVSMMAVGTAISAGRTILGGINANNTAKANAAALNQQALMREAKGDLDIEEARRRYERAQGNKVAQAAATGIDVRSFQDVLDDDAAEAGLERAKIRFGAQADADNIRFQAENTKSQGKSALIGSVFSAAGKVAAGYGERGLYEAKLSTKNSGGAQEYDYRRG